MEAALEEEKLLRARRALESWRMPSMSRRRASIANSAAGAFRIMAHAVAVIGMFVSYWQSRSRHRAHTRKLMRERLQIASILEQNALKGARRLQVC